MLFFLTAFPRIRPGGQACAPCSPAVVDCLLHGSFLECSLGYPSRFQAVCGDAPRFCSYCLQPAPGGSSHGAWGAAGPRGTITPARFPETLLWELLCAGPQPAEHLLCVQCGTHCAVAGSHLNINSPLLSVLLACSPPWKPEEAFKRCLPR